MSVRPFAATLGSFVLGSALLGGMIACQDDEPSPTNATPAAFLRDLRADNTTIDADGVSSTILRATIANGDSVERRLVTFSTTNGTLVAASPSPVAGSPTTVNADASGAASILLRASRTPGAALISASADQAVLTGSVTFAPALADSMTIETSGVQVRAGFDSSVLVTAQVRRNVGLVTPGALVRFSAATASGDSIGRFGIATRVDDNGVSTVRFYPADSAFVGRIVISATTTGREGRVVRAATSVNTFR